MSYPTSTQLIGATHTSKIAHGERGFHWTAPNGYKISVQSGKGNYCERRSVGYEVEPKDPYAIESKDFEMAMFYPNGEFVPIGYDEVDCVAGWIPAWALPRVMQSMRYFHHGTMKGDCAYLRGFRNTIERIREEDEKGKDSECKGAGYDK